MRSPNFPDLKKFQPRKQSLDALIPFKPLKPKDISLDIIKELNEIDSNIIVHAVPKSYIIQSVERKALNLPEKQDPLKIPDHPKYLNIQCLNERRGGVSILSPDTLNKLSRKIFTKHEPKIVANQAQIPSNNLVR